MNAARYLAVTAMLLTLGSAESQEPSCQKGASVPPAVIPHKFEAKVVSVLDGERKCKVGLTYDSKALLLCRRYESLTHKLTV